MSRYTLAIFSIFLFTHCKDPKCNERERFQQLVQSVIDSHDLEEHFIYENSKPWPVVIAKENLLYHDINLKKFGNPVSLMSIEEIDSTGTKAYVQFHNVTIYKDSAEVLFTYKIHGILGKQRYIIEECKWKLSSSRVGFID